MWGGRWATSCADLGPIGISAADCAANFGVNDDGVLVATGGADFKDGFVSKLWGTQVTVPPADGSNSYHWGNAIKVKDYSPACKRKHPTSFVTDCTLTEFLPFGNTTPDWNASFATNFRYKGLSVNSLLETSIGHSIYNGTAQWALRELRGEDIDQRGKDQGHQKPVGYGSTFYDVNSDNSWFREQGDWLKLREVSLGYTVPQSVIESMFGSVFDRVTLNVIGRNLITVTNYRGYDPEVGRSSGSLANQQINRVDSFGYPNFRTFSFSAELVF